MECVLHWGDVLLYLFSLPVWDTAHHEHLHVPLLSKADWYEAVRLMFDYCGVNS